MNYHHHQLFTGNVAAAALTLNFCGVLPTSTSLAQGGPAVTGRIQFSSVAAATSDSVALLLLLLLLL